MSNVPLPPNPCLLGILLVTKYQNEPSIVFHYPPRPGNDDKTLQRYLADAARDESSSSDNDSTSSMDDSTDGQILLAKGNEDPQTHDLEVDETGSASPEKPDGMREAHKQLSWDYIFGHNPVLLAKFISPVRSGHKKRSEVALNDKVFLGRPAFAGGDGEWRKRKRRLNGDDGPEASNGGTSESKSTIRKTSLQITQDMSETSEFETEADDQKLQDEKLKESSKELSHVSKQENEYKRIRRKDDLSMFQVVFIMSPPPLQYHLRVDEMYDHVVKKLSRALTWEQARSGFVSREARKIVHITNRSLGKFAGPNPPLAPLYHELLTGSTLAKAIANVYSSIATCRIAHVSLTPACSLSLQIPIPTSTSVLPSLIQPQFPGLWLTTATSISTDDDVHASSSQLASQFTLLLLSDLHVILADVHSTNSPLTEPLARFLRVSKPTKSFVQISQTSGIALSDIQFLASHLIHWRRARAIPPLHQRDTYIVSPNADMSRLATSTSSFAKLYPTLPALPKFLNSLSSGPRAYSTLIPSRDHKEAYMDILAWLFRHGWVTQLRTFAWILVPPHIQNSVTRQEQRRKESEKLIVTDHSEDGHLDVPNLSSSPTSSTHSSTRTALPMGPTTPLASPLLLPRPLHPTTASSAYLLAMSTHILATQGQDNQAAWDRCVKYFDGKYALETIAVREGWKRKQTTDLIAGWESLGFLRRARHW